MTVTTPEHSKGNESESEHLQQCMFGTLGRFFDWDLLQVVSPVTFFARGVRHKVAI